MNSIIYRFLKKKDEPCYVLYIPHNIDCDRRILSKINGVCFVLTQNIQNKELCNEISANDNTIICDKNFKFRPYQKPHIIICNNRRQVGYAIKYSDIFHCPIILIDHYKPVNQNDIEIIQSNKIIEQNGNFGILSMSKAIEDAWGTASDAKMVLDAEYTKISEFIDNLILRTYTR